MSKVTTRNGMGIHRSSFKVDFAPNSANASGNLWRYYVVEALVCKRLV